MDLSPSALLSLVRDTLADPRSTARRIMAIDVPLETRWMALAFTAVASTLLFHASLALLPAGAGQPLVPPLGVLLMQGAILFVAVQMIWRLGRRRGGRGTLEDTVSLMAWLQFVLLVVQALQVLAEVLLPPLAVMLGVAGMALFFWLLSQFVAELHGFESPFRVFLAILGWMFLAGFVLAALLTPFLPSPV